MEQELCHILFIDEPFVKDITGCLKPYAHNDFHVFRDKYGDLIAWDYDWDCGCRDCCTDNINDMCRVYWKVDKV